MIVSIDYGTIAYNLGIHCPNNYSHSYIGKYILKRHLIFECGMDYSSNAIHVKNDTVRNQV